jgi:hypothetical protein
MGTLLLQIRKMSDFCRIFRIMSNSGNIENQIRIHPSDIILKMNTNTDIHINVFSGYEYG